MCLPTANAGIQQLRAAIYGVNARICKQHNHHSLEEFPFDRSIQVLWNRVNAAINGRRNTTDEAGDADSPKR